MSAIKQLKAISTQAGAASEFAMHVAAALKEFSPAELEAMFANALEYVKPDWFGLELVEKAFLCSAPSPAERQAFESHIACEKLNAFFAGCLRLYPNNCRLSD